MTITTLTVSDLQNSKVSVITYNVRETGCFAVLRKLLLARLCVVVRVFFGSFGSFWIT